MKKKRDQKAQMEIMGLVIIIILVALAMLFVIQFIILRASSDLKEEFTQKELASNTVNSMLDTTTDCRGLSLAQLLEDCAEGGFTQCPSGNSCSNAENIINTILSNTLDVWNRDYYLTITTQGSQVLGTDFGTVCSGEKTTSSPCCIRPTGDGPMDVRLDICG